MTRLRAGLTNDKTNGVRAVDSCVRDVELATVVDGLQQALVDLVE